MFIAIFIELSKSPISSSSKSSSPKVYSGLVIEVGARLSSVHYWWWLQRSKTSKHRLKCSCPSRWTSSFPSCSCSSAGSWCSCRCTWNPLKWAWAFSSRAAVSRLTSSSSTGETSRRGLSAASVGTPPMKPRLQIWRCSWSKWARAQDKGVTLDRNSVNFSGTLCSTEVLYRFCMHSLVCLRPRMFVFCE